MPRLLPWWMVDRRDPQYREEEKFESQIRLEAEMRLQIYRCSELFWKLVGSGLSLESAVVIAEQVWEVKIDRWTLHYAQNEANWVRLFKGA